MKVQVKLLATHRAYLPPGWVGNTVETAVPDGATAASVLAQFGVPTDQATVILVNGLTPQPDQALQDGDVVCAFPAMAGG